MISIALLDPHPVVHKGFKSLFKKANHITVVKMFTKSDDLFDFLNENDLDALVLEMDLGGDSTVRIIKKIKKEFPEIAMIIFTALTQTIYGISLLKAGAAGFLSKEIEGKVMIEAVEKVVQYGYHITSNFANGINNNIDLSRPRNAYETLSAREVEVFKLLIEGKKNIQIAECLHINQKTVNTYKTRLMKKLEVEDPVDLFQEARNYDLI